MKRYTIMLVVFVLSLSLSTVSASALMYKTHPFNFENYEELKTHVFTPEKLKEQREDYDEEWYTFDKEVFLEFDKLFPCYSGRIDNDNDLYFYYDIEEGKNAKTYPIIHVKYSKTHDLYSIQSALEKYENKTYSKDEADRYFKDFNEEMAKDISKETVYVKKDGHFFSYSISEGDIIELVFGIGNYEFSFSSIDKTGDELAEYHNIYKSADEAIKVIKKFDRFINGPDYTPAIVISVSAAVLLAGGVAAVIYFKRKKTAGAATDK